MTVWHTHIYLYFTKRYVSRYRNIESAKKALQCICWHNRNGFILCFRARVVLSRKRGW